VKVTAWERSKTTSGTALDGIELVLTRFNSRRFPTVEITGRGQAHRPVLASAARRVQLCGDGPN